MGMSCSVENRSFSSSSLSGPDSVRAATGRKRVVGAPLVAFSDPDTVGATPREKLFNKARMTQSAADLISRAFACILVSTIGE